MAVHPESETQVSYLQKNWDLMFGVGGVATTLTLAQFNQLLACGAGVLTLIILGFRLRREWRHRNHKPD